MVKLDRMPVYKGPQLCKRKLMSSREFPHPPTTRIRVPLPSLTPLSPLVHSPLLRSARQLSQSRCAGIHHAHHPPILRVNQLSILSHPPPEFLNCSSPSTDRINPSQLPKSESNAVQAWKSRKKSRPLDWVKETQPLLVSARKSPSNMPWPRLQPVLARKGTARTLTRTRRSRRSELP